MKTIEQHFTVNYRFPIIFTRDVFNVKNAALAGILQDPGQKQSRMLVVIDSNVLDATPGLVRKIEKYAHHHSQITFVSPPLKLQGGEICKRDFSEARKVHSLIDKHHLCRHSYVIVIGGGAVLDAAGYAAATAHRGIRLIRMPTTTLAQNDAGVGVKNGINAYGRKNFLGTFAPPYAIINDFDFLTTLPAREMRAGIAEAVKVSLIRDRPFFDLLYEKRGELAVFEPAVMEKMIMRCAELHIEHIGKGGDPFEHGSSRPLDFGHWAAHKMEELSAGQINHGEAVAVGIALDSLYSFHRGMLGQLDLHRIFTTLDDIGFELYHWALGWLDIDAAIREFQEHLGGELTIPLLNGIGEKTEVHEVDTDLYRKCIHLLEERSKQKENRHEHRKIPDAGKTGSGDILH